MDKHKAHDILHAWNGGKAEHCPVCSSEMDDKAAIKEAQKVAGDNYTPRVNPNLPFNMRSAMTMTEADDSTSDNDTGKMETLHSMIDIMKFAEDGKVPTRIKMIPVGKFKTQAYGEITITKDKLKEMKKHFDEGVRAGVPIDFEHGESMYKGAAAGWLKKVDVSDDGLYGTVDWTELGQQKITSGEYKFYSPEFHFNYVDPEHSFELKNVLTGGGLVNKPMFKELPPLTASEKNLTENDNSITLYTELIKSSEKKEDLRTMNLKDIVAKEKSTRSSTEQQFLVEHKDELTFAEARTEGFVPEETKVVKASENEVVITAAEKKALEENAAKGVLAHEQLKRQNIEKEVRALTFSDKGTKIASDQVDPIVNLMLKMSEEDQATFKGVLEKLPEKEIFTEKGTSDEVKAGEVAATALTEKAKEIQAANKGMQFSEALSRAAGENPELVSGYQSNKPVAKAGQI